MKEMARKSKKNTRGNKSVPPTKKDEATKFSKKSRTTESGFSFSPAERKTISAENDPKWYSLNEQLLRDTASFPYSWPLGRSLNVGPFGLDMNKGSLPGVLTMNWIPTIGNSADATSAINVASINTYTKIRHDNSGHANYDHQDYAMYLLAMDSVYAFHSWMRRLYGVALTYDNTNRYYPVALIKSMGVDFGDLQAHLADFRAYVNAYAVKASALAVPAKMSFMTKHYWMSEGIYFDSKQDKPQTYLFNPLGFYQFGLQSGEVPYGICSLKPLFGQENAPKVKGKHIPGDPTTKQLKVSEIMKYGDELLDPIIADEDFGIMSGDTLKSFGVGGCYTLPVTPETYTVLPTYSDEVLDQVQNATFIGDPVIESSSITQEIPLGSANSGYIVATPKFAHPWVTALITSELPGQNAFLVDRFVTFMHGDITPENTMEATRWTNICTEVTSKDTREYSVATLGSEAMCHGFITYFAQPGGSSDGAQTPLFSDRIYVSMNIDINIPQLDPSPSLNDDGLRRTATTAVETAVPIIQKMMLLIQQLSVFDRHPPVYLTSYVGCSLGMKSPDGTQSFTGGAEKYGHLNGILSDINYYTVLGSRDLENLSHIALLSEFDVTVR